MVFYFKGNTRSIKGWAKFSQDFLSKECSFFIIDYPRFGKSTGDRTEQDFYSDGRQLMSLALKHYSSSDIILYGRSLGSGVSSKLATEFHVRKLILETPYYSIKSLFYAYYPFFPRFLFLFKYKFPVYKNVEEVQYPVVIFHGTRDRVIPYSESKKLKAMESTQLKFITIAGAKHGNLGDYREFGERLAEALDSDRIHYFVI